jgi:hypothetical protein
MDYQAQMQSLMTRLHAMQSGQPLQPEVATTAPPQPAQQAITPDQIAAIVDASLKRAMPQLMGMVNTIDGFFNRALPPEELAAFKAYRDQGAPGLKAMLDSDTLFPIAQLMWEMIKENAKNAQ